MTHDPSVAVQVVRGLIYCAISIATGVALGLLFVAILPKSDED